MAEKSEKITLSGGPGDGQSHEWFGGEVLRWVPKADAEREAAGNLGEVLYRRSMRTTSIFVWQP